MRLPLILLLAAVGVSNAWGENEESLFDFWVGEWELSWTAANGFQGRGVNRIEKILDEKVIEENFSAANGYKGRSLSVYNPQSREWRQVWTDNRGGFLVFWGERDGEKRIFKSNTVESDGKSVVQRMVFHSIEEDSFTWEWMRSEDGGENWKTTWKIFYVRKGGAE